MEKQGKNVINSIVLVLVVVLVVAISALIVGSVLGAEVFSGTSGSTVENVSNVTNITAVNFGILSTSSDATCILLEVKNAADQVAIASGNFTQPTTCTIQATSASNFIGNAWQVNYTFTTPGAAGSVINITELTDGFGGFVTGLISFLAVIGIIIGVMWLVFYIRPLFSKEEGVQNFDAN